MNAVVFKTGSLMAYQGVEGFDELDGGIYYYDVEYHNEHYMFIIDKSGVVVFKGNNQYYYFAKGKPLYFQTATNIKRHFETMTVDELIGYIESVYTLMEI